jgi:hypothetical protein
MHWPLVSKLSPLRKLTCEDAARQPEVRRSAGAGSRKTHVPTFAGRHVCTRPGATCQRRGPRLADVLMS